jgi:hypothetical protein
LQPGREQKAAFLKFVRRAVGQPRFAARHGAGSSFIQVARRAVGQPSFEARQGAVSSEEAPYRTDSGRVGTAFNSTSQVEYGRVGTAFNSTCQVEYGLQGPSKWKEGNLVSKISEEGVMFKSYRWALAWLLCFF